MGKDYSYTNHKGGVGKTTTSIILGLHSSRRKNVVMGSP